MRKQSTECYKPFHEHCFPWSSGMNGADSVNGGTGIRGLLPAKMLTELAVVSQRRHRQAAARAAECTDPLPPRIQREIEERKARQSYSTITKFVKSKPFRQTQAGRVYVRVTHTHTHTHINTCFYAALPLSHTCQLRG